MASIERKINGTFAPVPGGYAQQINEQTTLFVPDFSAARYDPKTGELFGYAPDYAALEAEKAPAVQADKPGEYVYCYEMQQAPTGCDFAADLSYYGKHYFLRPLRDDLPQLHGRGISYDEERNHTTEALCAIRGVYHHVTLVEALAEPPVEHDVTRTDSRGHLASRDRTHAQDHIKEQPECHDKKCQARQKTHDIAPVVRFSQIWRRMGAQPHVRRGRIPRAPESSLRGRSCGWPITSIAGAMSSHRRPPLLEPWCKRSATMPVANSTPAAKIARA